MTPTRTTLLLLSLCGGVALAQPRPPHGPPPEALKACEGKSAGAACTVTPPDRPAVEGTCRTPPHGNSGELVCAPAHRGPPPEALKACEGSAEGAACSVVLHGEARAGRCQKPPHGGTQLGCLPDGMKGPRHHGPPPEAFASCEGKSEGATCAAQLPGGGSEGTCRKFPGDGRMACAPRDLPPQPGAGNAPSR